MWIFYLLTFILSGTSIWPAEIVENFFDSKNTIFIFYDEKTPGNYKNITFCCCSCIFNYMSTFFKYRIYETNQINFSEYEKYNNINFLFVSNINYSQNTANSKIFFTENREIVKSFNFNVLSNHENISGMGATAFNCVIS